MIDDDLTLLRNDPEWQNLLQAYADRMQEARQVPGEVPAPRGCHRIPELDGIDPQRLSGLHGAVIARGWLVADLEENGSGLLYRLTLEGRQALALLARMPSSEQADAAA